MPEAMALRRQTDRRTPVRGPQGLIGATHFLTRTLDKVRTEMSLHFLADNLKRMRARRLFGQADLGSLGAR
jgi:hypothetical protein